MKRKFQFTIREISETTVTSVYLLMLITVTKNVHVGRKRGFAKSRFLRGQFESGLQTIGQQINQ
jgi:hypothetical protein